MALILDENGGSVELCVVKRSGSVPETGLTVQLRFGKIGDMPLAGKIMRTVLLNNS